MKFIHKNVNTALLFFVIALAVSLVFLTTYNHLIYSRLSNDYYTKAKELNKVTNDLVLHKSRLNRTLTQYQIKDEREKDLSSKYTELRDLKEQLKQLLNKTNETLEDTKSELDRTQQELISSVKQIEEKNLQILTLDTNIRNMESTISRYNSAAKKLETDVDYLKDEINDYLNDAATSGACKTILSDVKSRVVAVDEDAYALRRIS